jgi:hypothetical protein
MTESSNEEREAEIVAKAREHAIRLSELTEPIVFYEREGTVVVRNPEKLIALLNKAAPDVATPVPNGKAPFPCPNCGGESMSTVDDVLAFRAIHRFDDGTLITDGMDDYSDGDNTRLHCHSCQCNFAIPGGAAIDWED